MKTWKIPVSWEVCAMISVEAETLEEAIDIARDDDGVIPCPQTMNMLTVAGELPKKILCS